MIAASRKSAGSDHRPQLKENTFVPNLTVLQLIVASVENQQAVTTDHSSKKILLNSFVPNLTVLQLIVASVENQQAVTTDHRPQLKDNTTQFFCSKPRCANICKPAAYFRWQACCNLLHVHVYRLYIREIALKAHIDGLTRKKLQPRKC